MLFIHNTKKMVMSSLNGETICKIYIKDYMTKAKLNKGFLQ